MDGGTHGRHLHGATIHTGYEWPSTMSEAKSEAFTPSGRDTTEKNPRKGGGRRGGTAAQRLSGAPTMAPDQHGVSPCRSMPHLRS
jgi:hypothetical protein